MMPSGGGGRGVMQRGKPGGAAASLCKNAMERRGSLLSTPREFRRLRTAAPGAGIIPPAMRRLLAALELRIPPPLVAVLCIGLMLKLAWTLRAWQYPFAGRFMLASVVAVAGLALALAGVRALRRAHTTISPFSPHKTAMLVVHGIYARTRNPMYLGLALVLFGVAIALANPATIAGPLLFVLWIDRFQIRPEERVLTERIGSVYTDYLASTPRWL